MQCSVVQTPPHATCVAPRHSSEQSLQNVIKHGSSLQRKPLLICAFITFTNTQLRLPAFVRCRSILRKATWTLISITELLSLPTSRAGRSDSNCLPHMKMFQSKVQPLGNVHFRLCVISSCDRRTWIHCHPSCLPSWVWVVREKILCRQVLYRLARPGDAVALAVSFLRPLALRKVHGNRRRPPYGVCVFVTVWWTLGGDEQGT